MKGSIHYRKDRGVWFVNWWDIFSNKSYKIYRYKGEIIYSKKIAQKLLSTMQGDYENGTFRIEKFLLSGWTDTVPYLFEWLDVIKDDVSPATYKDYSNSIRNHLKPFFTEHFFQLHEIQYDVLRKLLKSINRSGKGKLNVMYCLHACLKYAWQSKRISEVPPFPEKKLYQITEPVIQWLPSDRQIKIIEAIPSEHQPIFWWLKYHLRRPSEAMSLHRVDYNKEYDSFIIRHGISARKVVDFTKTKKEHIIPCHPVFLPIMKKMPVSVSKYFFTCKTSRSEGKRYTDRIMNRLWNNACEKVGEDISMYAGLKHSSCSQYVNECGLSLSDLQEITDHARLDSVKKYARMEVARKRELMNKNIISFPEVPLKKS
ncbi:MAG: tyrosine-type recombinase/integrase [Desulfobulbaceae bacterium]|nr:tyrosine-type recombinase/integrase [Desulfobulbaceae bacterium]